MFFYSNFVDTIHKITTEIKYLFENTILKIFEMYKNTCHFFLRLNYYYKSINFPSYLYDYRYINNAKDISFPFRKIVRACFIDSNNVEVLFSNDQLDSIRNIGSKRKNISLKDIYVFCSIEYNISSIILTNISSSGINKIRITRDKPYEIKSSNFFST